MVIWYKFHGTVKALKISSITIGISSVLLQYFTAGLFLKLLSDWDEFILLFVFFKIYFKKDQKSPNCSWSAS